MYNGLFTLQLYAAQRMIPILPMESKRSASDTHWNSRHPSSQTFSSISAEDWWEGGVVRRRTSFDQDTLPTIFSISAFCSEETRDGGVRVSQKGARTLEGVLEEEVYFASVRSWNSAPSSTTRRSMRREDSSGERVRERERRRTRWTWCQSWEGSWLAKAFLTNVSAAEMTVAR